MPELPTGTVTLLFTDIAGSTRLLQRAGAQYASLLETSRHLLRAASLECHGHEVDTQGDAFFVAFAAAPEALAAAAEVIRVLAEHAWPEGGPLRVRIGLHTGTPQLAGDHYVGIDVHRAARIAVAGHGGQILLSASTRILSAQNLPEGTTLHDLGTYRLKDLQHPEPTTQLVLAEMPSDFPPLQTLDRRAHNLPIQPTELLGRDESVVAVCALLQRSGVRLVTVTGAGGIGKTRFDLQVAAEILENFPDGVWFVRLSRLVNPELVLPTIAQTLGVQEVLGQPIAQTLSEHLREKQLLLVLDNFEQVVAAAPQVGDLLAESPGLKVLVTSWVPLRLRGERDYALRPLPLPEAGVLPQPNQLTQYAAVALLVERASAARSDFFVTAANAPAIAEICARLDGLPLAIELAAARVRLLSPEALLSRLSHQLHLLTGGARDLEARQQTMRATIAWSVALLHPEEQALFRRLSVFVGGGTLEAIEAVCLQPEGVESQQLDLLDGLEVLVDQSLLQRREEGDELRFGMLYIIREFAPEQLAASGETEVLGRAHSAFYLTVALPIAATGGNIHDVAWCKAHLAWLALLEGQDAGAEVLLHEAVAVQQRLKDTDCMAISQGLIGLLALERGDVAGAQGRLGESLTLYTQVGKQSGIAETQVLVGHARCAAGDLGEAEAAYVAGLQLERGLGNKQRAAAGLAGLAEVALAQGLPERAARLLGTATQALASVPRPEPDSSAWSAVPPGLWPGPGTAPSAARPGARRRVPSRKLQRPPRHGTPGARRTADRRRRLHPAQSHARATSGTGGRPGSCGTNSARPRGNRRRRGRSAAG